MKEVFRWRPALASSTPHQSTEDDIYNGTPRPALRLRPAWTEAKNQRIGYFIPKGSVVMQNSWYVLFYVSYEIWNLNDYLQGDGHERKGAS